MGPIDARFNAEAIQKIQPVIECSQTIMGGLPKTEVRIIGASFFLPKKPVWKDFSPPDLQDQKTELTRLIRDKACRNLLAHGTESSYTLAQIFYDKELKLSTRHETCGNLHSESSIHDACHGGYKDYGWGVFVLEGEILEKASEPTRVREDKMIIPIPSIRAVLFPWQIVSSLRATYPEYAGKIKGYVEFGESV